MNEEPEKSSESEKFSLIFKNGALANLKELAKTFNIPEDDLRQVVRKGINLLTLVKEAKSLTLEDKNGDKYTINIEKL